MPLIGKFVLQRVVVKLVILEEALRFFPGDKAKKNDVSSSVLLSRTLEKVQSGTVNILVMARPYLEEFCHISGSRKIETWDVRLRQTW